MPRTYSVYLNDILKAIQKIERYLQGVDQEQFRRADIEADATLYNLLIIGEAAKHVPNSIRTKYPDVNWRSIGGFRNIAAHEYFRVNLEIVWNIVQEDFPELKAQIIDILEKEDDSDSA